MAQQEAACMKPFYISKDFIYMRIFINCHIRVVKTNQFGEKEFILYIELRYQLISYIQVSFLIRLRKPLVIHHQIFT